MLRSAMFIVTVLTAAIFRTQSLAGQLTDGHGKRTPNALTLFEAVERGLTVDPRTAAARAQQTASAASVRAATAARWPTMAVQGSAIRFQEPMIAAPLHAFNPASPPVFSRTLVQSNWTTSYTIFDGGVRSAAIQGARASDLVASAMATATEMTVIESVANAFLSVVALRELGTAEQRRLISLEGERDRAQQLFDVGRTPRVSVLRAEAAMANARASNVATEQQLRAAQRELARLVAMPFDSLRQLEPVSLVQGGADELDPNVLMSRATQLNPQVAMALNDVEVSRASERSARAAWWPSVQLAAGVATYAGSGVDLQGEWQGGLSISYPLFAGGARHYRVAGAVAAREAAESSVRARELEVAIQIDHLISQIIEHRARLSALNAAVSYAEEVVRTERLALTTGAGVQTDFLNAEADLFAARANLVQATQGEITARIALAAATGDLSLDWLRATVEIQQ